MHTWTMNFKVKPHILLDYTVKQSYVHDCAWLGKSPQTKKEKLVWPCKTNGEDCTHSGGHCGW